MKISNNYGLSESIKCYKQTGTEDSVTVFFKEFYEAWRVNRNVYVPVLYGYEDPYDWGMIPTDGGVCYVIYTEERLIEKWNGEPVVEGSYIKEVPLQEVVKRLRMLQGKPMRIGSVVGIAINPIQMPPYDSPYSLGLDTESVLRICKGIF